MEAIKPPFLFMKNLFYIFALSNKHSTMRTIYKVIFIAFIIVSLSSCYAMSDDGVLSSTDYNVVVSNGYPYYNRDRRIVYYYYNRDYYYPYYYKGHRCFKKYYRPLPPPRRHRPPQRGFDRKPPKIVSLDGRKARR